MILLDHGTRSVTKQKPASVDAPAGSNLRDDVACDLFVSAYRTRETAFDESDGVTRVIAEQATMRDKSDSSLIRRIPRAEVLRVWQRLPFVFADDPLGLQVYLVCAWYAQEGGGLSTGVLFKLLGSPRRAVIAAVGRLVARGAISVDERGDLVDVHEVVPREGCPLLDLRRAP